jgi:hypothetical protein
MMMMMMMKMVKMVKMVNNNTPPYLRRHPSPPTALLALLSRPGQTQATERAGYLLQTRAAACSEPQLC